jgi:hypothetical protein
MYFQGKNQGPVEPYGLNAARSPVPPQDPCVKTVPGFFFEYLEEMQGPFIPPGQGLPQFMGFKEDQVHPIGISQKGRTGITLMLQLGVQKEKYFL